MVFVDRKILGFQSLYFRLISVQISDLIFRNHLTYTGTEVGIISGFSYGIVNFKNLEFFQKAG
jgi:hypothetical protein